MLIDEEEVAAVADGNVESGFFFCFFLWFLLRFGELVIEDSAGAEAATVRAYVGFTAASEAALLFFDALVMVDDSAGAGAETD